jgi:hypothetical protein
MSMYVIETTDRSGGRIGSTIGHIVDARRACVERPVSMSVRPVTASARSLAAESTRRQSHRR